MSVVGRVVHLFGEIDICVSQAGRPETGIETAEQRFGTLLFNFTRRTHHTKRGKRVIWRSCDEFVDCRIFAASSQVIEKKKSNDPEKPLL